MRTTFWVIDTHQVHIKQVNLIWARRVQGAAAYVPKSQKGKFVGVQNCEMEGSWLMWARLEEIAGATGDIEGTGALIIHQAEELRGNIDKIFRDSEKY